MKTIQEKWQDVRFESSCEKTPEFLAFAKDFKKEVKKKAEENGFKLIAVNTGHFYLSGFLQKNDKFVYFSSSNIRLFPNEWRDNLLIRTAKNVKDYTGGQNCFTSLDLIGQKALALIS